MLNTTDTSVETSPAITLMGTDVERIVTTLQYVISIAPDFIQVGLAVWILETRLGPICVAPVIVALSKLRLRSFVIHMKTTNVVKIDSLGHHISPGCQTDQAPTKTMDAGHTKKSRGDDTSNGIHQEYENARIRC